MLYQIYRCFTSFALVSDCGSHEHDNRFVQKYDIIDFIVFFSLAKRPLKACLLRFSETLNKNMTTVVQKISNHWFYGYFAFLCRGWRKHVYRDYRTRWMRKCHPLCTRAPLFQFFTLFAKEPMWKCKLGSRSKINKRWASIANFSWMKMGSCSVNV